MEGIGLDNMLGAEEVEKMFNESPAVQETAEEDTVQTGESALEKEE